MSGKCKQCRRAYIQHHTPAAAAEIPTTPHYYKRIVLGKGLMHAQPDSPSLKTTWIEFMRTYRAQLALFLCCIIGLSICYEALDCITLDLLAGEELQGLTDADYLYLPVIIVILNQMLCLANIDTHDIFT